MTAQKAINEHQKTTDQARSNHRSVLRDAAKERVGTSVASTTVRDPLFASCQCDIENTTTCYQPVQLFRDDLPCAKKKQSIQSAAVSKTPSVAQMRAGHDVKLPRKKSPLPPPVLSTTSGLPASGGNVDDLPSKKLSTETLRSRWTQHVHRVPYARRESNELQANKKLLAKPPVSLRGATKQQPSMQHPVSSVSSVPSPQKELPPEIKRLLTNSGIPVSLQTHKNNEESQGGRQTHSIGSLGHIGDENKFEHISDHEALLMIK